MDYVIILKSSWLKSSWYPYLGGFLSIDLTHARIPMEDGTFDILYIWESTDKHVMDPNGPGYTSEFEFDEFPNTIEYDPWDLPFMQEDCIDTLLPRKYEYMENLTESQGKGLGSI